MVTREDVPDDRRLARPIELTVVDAGGALLYQSDGNKADISGFLDAASFDVDLVITGHLHVANRLEVPGRDVPVLATGPTLPINKTTTRNRPSTWLLTDTRKGLELDRHPL